MNFNTLIQQKQTMVRLQSRSLYSDFISGKRYCKSFFLVCLFVIIRKYSNTKFSRGYFTVYYLRQKKKTDNDVEIVKIVNVFKENWTKAILMRKDVPNPGKLVQGPYDQPFSSNIDFSIDFGGKTCMKKPLCHFQNHILSLYRYNF